MPDLDSLTMYTSCRIDGEVATVSITVELPEGVHIEPHRPADPLLIPTVLDTTDLSDPEWTYPSPVTKDLGFEDMTLQVLEGTIEFTVTGRLATDGARVRGTIHFQPCIGGACLPPRTVEWDAPVDGATGYSVLGALAA